jgi:hypothetical protein
VSSFAVTVVLIVIFLGGYLIYSTCIAPQRERGKTGGGGGNPPPDVKTTERQKGGKESQPLASWQNAITTGSNKLLAQLKTNARNRKRNKDQNDEENGAHVRVIEAQEKESEK